MKKVFLGILSVIVLTGIFVVILVLRDEPSLENNSQPLVTQQAARESVDVTPSTMSQASATPLSKRYVTTTELSEQGDQYKDAKKVYFFHASWCPICRSIDESIQSDPSVIPDNVVFVKTDFDTEKALKQKYGVTTQYTFVQVDSKDNEVKQWSATSLERALAQVQ